MNATAHPATCECGPCLVADMNAHLASIGFEGAGGPVTAQEMNADYSERTRYATPGQRCGRGYVRKVSDKQVKYMLFLFKSRDTSGLTRLPGSENIESMSLAGARDLIDRLLACPVKAGMPTVRMATDGQLSFIDSLISQRDVPADSREWFDAKKSEITFQSANEMIGRLKALPYAKCESETLIPNGRYAIENADGELRFYHVRTSKSSGRQYVCVMASDNEIWVKGSAGQSIIRKIAEIGAQDAMLRYGREIGACGHCGRTLTDEASREAGIGPICAGKAF